MKRPITPTVEKSTGRAARPSPAPSFSAIPAQPPTRKRYIRVKCEPEVAARLKALAERNRFSMNAQIDLMTRYFE